MTRIDIRHQQHAATGRRHAPAPVRWRIGKASVSTEELQAWQLGPARTDHWLTMDGAARRPQR